MPLAPMLFVAFLAVPLIEVALFVQIGGWLGLWPTLLLCVATAAAGSFVIRRQGVDVARRARTRLDQGVMPLAEGFDGLCLVVAGFLLITPGFFTDTVGALLLLPPVRRNLYGRFARNLPTPPPGRGEGQRPPEVIEVDYEVVDDDPPPPRGGWDRR